MAYVELNHWVRTFSKKMKQEGCIQSPISYPILWSLQVMTQFLCPFEMNPLVGSSLSKSQNQKKFRPKESYASENDDLIVKHHTYHMLDSLDWWVVNDYWDVMLGLPTSVRACISTMTLLNNLFIEAQRSIFD